MSNFIQVKVIKLPMPTIKKCVHQFETKFKLVIKNYNKYFDNY